MGILIHLTVEWRKTDFSHFQQRFYILTFQILSVATKHNQDNTKVNLSPTSSLLKCLLFSPRQKNVPDFPKEKHFSVNWMRSWNTGVLVAEITIFFLFLLPWRGVKPWTLQTGELSWSVIQCNWESHFVIPALWLSLNFSDFP